MWYCVIAIATGEVCYRGRSEDGAATKWNPGTAIGMGQSKYEAEINARKSAGLVAA